MNPAQAVIGWYHAEGRRLPWRLTRDPYSIWISEVVLQQTRIAQGIGYYERFVSRFPDVHSLAAASLDEVLKYWEGLGYYSRARNLHATARHISETRGGKFPDTWQELLTLKGIGPYTARAIGSMAFGNRVGVVDGNVFRILSRYLADASPVDLPATRVRFQEILDSWLREADAAAFNQGFMDLGSVICTPQKPGCLVCPLQENCRAYAAGAQSSFPVKGKKAARAQRYYHFFMLRDGRGGLCIRQRPAQGLWGGLWEIPNAECADEAAWKAGPGDGFRLLGSLKHVFTHFDMHIRVYEGPAGALLPGERFADDAEIRIFAFSRAVLKIFERFAGNLS